MVDVNRLSSLFEMDFKELLVASLAKGEDNTDFWFAELSSLDTMAAALKRAVKEVCEQRSIPSNERP